MSDLSIYRELALRTKGNLYIGVVGPVRTGKSTFIKRFMEKLIIPAIEDPYLCERTKDELPQCGSGRNIMTSEPKFIPEEAVSISVDNDIICSVRLVDCVGYMVNGAAGNIENGAERMVMTPWFEHEIPMTKAAEEGTKRVINEHSTLGIIVSTDGSICGIPREDYIQPEETTVSEMKKSGKPFTLIINSSTPTAAATQALTEHLSNKYKCSCIALNCIEMDENDIRKVLGNLLQCFPIERYYVYLPQWLEALSDENELKNHLYDKISLSCCTAQLLGERYQITESLKQSDNIKSVEIRNVDMSEGSISVDISVPRKLYYETISAESGYTISNDRDLMEILTSMSSLKDEYERIHEALEDVKEFGYGIVMPGIDDMKMEEPQVVRQGGRYGVKLKASAPSIHMIRTNIETEVSPAIGGEKSSDDMINLLMQSFDGDMSRIWESNIFGKSLNDIAGEALAGKIKALPVETKTKLKGTIERIVNEGSNGLICIIL